jgi:hypothetical protein
MAFNVLEPMPRIRPDRNHVAKRVATLSGRTARVSMIDSHVASVS